MTFLNLAGIAYTLSKHGAMNIQPKDNRRVHGIPLDRKTNTNGSLLVFLVPPTAEKVSSFSYQASMKASGVQKLFKKLGANPDFLRNKVGWHDYR
ncbi:hypothetical protein MAC_06789 [Metarhizium acridum CQMa 102]|uniref:Uncharacterized protein n=1 Tax=Metarhizium acridum (strain CQMa 102) TaxID=655827 RepID=E9EA90_METAQ|nr:uncharacterized protein MAC_06789 [Metarhizium acridum CQMa 102]EFY87111.1 hypothetical protein MAC_06789 [Metarhizium acridum CQMa 102]